MKNTFSGNTLEQNLVTYDESGIPRRSVRRITNYDIPAQADTTYRDARGLWASKNPSWFAKLTGNVHTQRFMDTVDSNLKGFEPAQLNGREVKKTQKNQKGGLVNMKKELSKSQNLPAPSKKAEPKNDQKKYTKLPLEKNQVTKPIPPLPKKK